MFGAAVAFVGGELVVGVDFAFESFEKRASRGRGVGGWVHDPRVQGVRGESGAKGPLGWGE